MHSNQQPIKRTPDQIAQLVEAVERCTLSPAEFGHHAHIDRRDLVPRAPANRKGNRDNADHNPAFCGSSWANSVVP